MGTEKSETRAVPADAGDIIGGNMGDHGEKLAHGQPVTETTTETDDDDDEKEE